MEQILTDQGHECIAVLVGTSKFRKTPEFFNKYFDGKITEFSSPNFIRDAANKSIRLLRSFIYNLFHSHHYFKSISIINQTVKKLQPDLILSFYEPLTGLYRFFYKKQIPCISVAHEFGWKHTGYISGGSFAEAFAIRLLTYISAYGSDKLFCIYPKEKSNHPDDKIVFIPPLIRKEIKNAIVGNNGSITGYLLNSGYKDEIIKWHKTHPDQEIHCFIDSPDSESQNNPTLHFHQIDDKMFIEYFSSCRALISTAGFETICEAMYLGKPVLMVPVKNHFEQHLNSILFERFGAGLQSDFFDIDKLLNFTRSFEPVKGFKEWTEKGPDIIEKYICELLNIKTGK
jgi:uncharacterized protein (TIGR00661 family)